MKRINTQPDDEVGFDRKTKTLMDDDTSGRHMGQTVRSRVQEWVARKETGQLRINGGEGAAD